MVDALSVKRQRAALTGHQLQQRAAGGRFTTARLPHQRQGLSGIEIKTDFFDGMNPAFNPIQQTTANIKAGDQIAHLQNRRLQAAYRILRHVINGITVQQGEFGGQRLPLHRAEFWHRRQQRLCIGLLWCAEQLGDRSIFHYFAAIHHLHPVGHFGDHAHIVSDKNHSHLHLFLQHADQLQNLRLNGDVERGSRFIGNQ